MPRSFRFGAVVLIVVAQLAIGSLATVAALTKGTPGAPSPPQRGTAAPSATSSLRQTAAIQARAWRSNATLIEEVSWLSWPSDPATSAGAPVNGWSTFVFASGGDRLAIVVDRGSGFILGQHTQQLGVVTPRLLDPAALPITAETVSALAELAGGRSYREACPNHRNLSKVGATLDANGTPIWVATYADDRTSNNPDVTVVVNGKTGVVERKSVAAPPCVAG